MTGAALLVGGALASAPAQAATDAPFDPSVPTVFIAQGTPSTLSRTVVGPDGSASFQGIGTADLTYNAVGYNPADNYLYAITQTTNGTIPANALIRIGSDGTITRIGNLTYTGALIGAFGPNNYLYVLNGSLGLQGIDVSTGAPVSTVHSSTPAGKDYAYADGYFWAMGLNKISRTDPVTGTQTSFTLPFATDFSTDPTDQGGAAWTYGNGNLGFSYNDSGTIYQVAVADAASAAPTFTLVSANPGPANTTNDGASTPGVDTDLALTKTNPTGLTPETTGEYDLTVTNHGPGQSSGYVVTDSVPAPLTNVTTTSPGCTVTGTTVTCLGGVLDAGDSVTYKVNVDVPAGLTGDLTNTASVIGNEADSDTTNNTSTVMTQPPAPSIAVVKTSDVNSVDAVGQVVKFSFDVTNTGNVPLSGVGVSDDAATGFTGTGTLPPVDCPSTTLAIGGDEVCTTSYTVTQADVDAGSIDNSATVEGTAPAATVPVTGTATPITVTATQKPSLGLTGSADVDSIETAGMAVKYTFTVTNTGNVTITDPAVTASDFNGGGTLSNIVCPSGTVLAPGESVKCTATYTTVASDLGRRTLIVNGTATGTTSTAQTVSSNRTAVDVPITATPATSASSKPGTAALASTGSTVVGPALGGGLLLLLAGGGFLLLRRRRGNAKA